MLERTRGARRFLRTSLLAPLVVLTAVAPACSAPAGSGDAPAVFSYVPVGAETIAPTEVFAGDTITPTCLLLNAEGETFAPPPGITPVLRWVPAASVDVMGAGALAMIAGDVEVSCTFPSLLVTDETPAVVHIRPGFPARVETTVDPRSVPAGRGVAATCTVWDDYGNLVEGAEATLSVLPTDGTTIEGLGATFTRSGRYEVACNVAGAMGNVVGIEVTPGLPYDLVLARVPNEPVYGIGDVIQVRSIVSDRYGNEVPEADVVLSSDPVESARLGDGFRYAADGHYRVTGRVSSLTDEGRLVTASTEIVINGTGPTIRCEEPLDGSMLVGTPGTPLTVRGSVDDTSGTRSVRVNGTEAVLSSDGFWNASITPLFGMNFIDVVAVDDGGIENSRTCSFILADRYAPENDVLGDTVMLDLTQEAIDDTSRSDGLDSLNDILYTVINSAGLRNTLHSSLLASNPIKPSSCDVDTFLGCAIRTEIRYLDSRIDGPHTTSLTLVPDGLRARVNMRGLHVQLRVNGRAAGIGFDTTGWVNIDSVDVDVTFDVGLAGGRPRINVRPGTVSVSVGRISTDFSGLAGGVIDIVVSVANGTVRDALSGVVRDFVTNNFNSVLDGLVSSLDVSTFGASFDVPRLDGSGTIPLSFGLAFSSLSADPARLLFGIGTRMSATPAHARPSLGIPLPLAPVRIDPTTSRPVVVAVHTAMLNQAIHALWRGGLLDADIGEGGLGGLPAGVSLDIRGGLPPVARVVASNQVELAIGALHMNITYPGLFDDLDVTLGARATTSTTLAGDDLMFGAVTITELHFSTGSVTLSGPTRDLIEDLLRTLVQRIVDTSLNDALPAIPIPSFSLPASVATFGLPAGAEMGITGPALTLEGHHIMLRGGFGMR